MEKPFVLGGELEKIDYSQAARALLMIDLNRRFWPLYQELKELVTNRSIGIIEHARFSLQVDVKNWCSVTAHRLSPTEGGLLFDLGSQVLDLVHYVLGRKLVRIKAERSGQTPESNCIRMHVEIRDGPTVECEISYSKHNEESICIRGDEGTLLVKNPNMTIQILPKNDSKYGLRRRFEDLAFFGYRGLRRNRSMLRSTIRASLGFFLEAVKSGKPFSPGFEDAVYNALCLEAATRSFTTGSSVSVEEVKEETQWLK